MHGSKQDLPVAFADESVGVDSRQIEWGSMHAAIEAFWAGVDAAAVFKGLPDDRCQCEHWGYVVSGRLRVRYQDKEEHLVAGDAFYMPPGHTTIFEEDTQIVQFSPRGEYQKTMDAVARNMAALQQA